MEYSSHIKRLLSATGDPVRLDIIFLLGAQQRMHVTAIAAQFSLSRPAISHHLKVLREADVVRSEKVGQEIYYWLNRDYVVSELQGLAARIAACTGGAENS